jgi:hypothetical protein
MQKVKTPFIPLSQPEIDTMNPNVRKEYFRHIEYAKISKDCQYWHRDDLEELTNRDDVFLEYNNLMDRYIFVANSSADILKAYNKFKNADKCKFFNENVKIFYKDDDLISESTTVNGFTIDFNQFMLIDEAIVLVPIVQELCKLNYIGSLVFPCIVSVWMSAAGYGRSIDGTTILTLKDLGVSKFADLDK